MLNVALCEKLNDFDQKPVAEHRQLQILAFSLELGR